MRAAQSWPVVNSVTLSSFAEGRMRLFGAEIFNNFSVAIAVSETGWKQRIHATYKPRQVVIRKCLPVLAQKLALFGFKLSNGVKIAAIYLGFTFRILENSCRRSVLITALFTMGGAISMGKKCLWLIFRVHRTQYLH